MKVNVIYIFNGIERIGHISYEIWQLRNLFQENEFNVTIITLPIDHQPRTNKSFYNVAMRGLNVINMTDVASLYQDINLNTDFNQKRYISDGNELFFFYTMNYSNKVFPKQFAYSTYNYYFTLSQREINLGRKIRTLLKIPINAPIVTLHARSSGYLPFYNYHSLRDVDIEDYVPAIQYLINKGFYVVRLGDKSMKKLLNAPPCFIDLPFCSDYTDFFDPFLIAESKFFIGSSSGPETVAYGMGTPVVMTNYRLSSNYYGTERNIIIFKKYYSCSLKRYLTYNEIIHSPAFEFWQSKYFHQAGIELVKNTPEEILMAVKEMTERIKGIKYDIKFVANIDSRINYFNDKMYKELSKQNYSTKYDGNLPTINHSLNNLFLFSNAQISLQYLKLNPHFLGHDWSNLEWATKILHSTVIDSLIKGESYFKNQQFEKSEQLFQSVLSIDYRNKIAFNNLGVIAFYKNEIDQSIEYFTSCLKIDPMYRDAIINFYKTLKHSKQFSLFFKYTITNYCEKNIDDFEIHQLKDTFYSHLTDETSTLVSINQVDKTVKDLIIKIKPFLNHQANLIHKPHRNLVLSGIPGSGISLFSQIINKMDNITFSKTNISDIKTLPRMYAEHRNKYLGQIKSELDSLVDEDCVVGFYQNLAYYKLNEIQGFKNDELDLLLNMYGYRIISIVRDPVYTIINWNKPESYNHLPEACVTDEDMSPKWNRFNFHSKNKIERQAQIWEFYANFYLSLRDMLPPEPHWIIKPERIKIYHYEQINLNLNHVMKDMCDYLSLPFPEQIDYCINRNNISKYHNIDEIKEAVEKFCPSRYKLGYIDAGSENTVPLSISDLVTYTGKTVSSALKQGKKSTHIDLNKFHLGIACIGFEIHQNMLKRIFIIDSDMKKTKHLLLSLTKDIMQSIIKHINGLGQSSGKVDYQKCLFEYIKNKD